jgi:hypothetical protein
MRSGDKPHGCTAYHGSSSIAMLMPMPCIETQCFTAMPMEANLRPFANTPVPSTEPLAVTPNAAADSDAKRLEAAQPVAEVAARQGHDRVDDELAGAVVGDLAAAFDRHDAFAEVGRRRRTAGGVDRVVFDEQDAPRIPARVHLGLQGPHLLQDPFVRDATEILDIGGHDGHTTSP